jgi:hypothetical protein
MHGALNRRVTNDSLALISGQSNMSDLENEPIDGAPTDGKEANRFTREDFAFEVLIEFASRNKLPLKIQTQSVVFKNIDRDYKSGDKSAPPTPAGFAVDVAIASGASVIARNATAVADKDLLPGNLFLEFNKGHVQVVTSATPDRVEIMQGNFPGLESNPRKIMSKILFGKWLRATNAGNRESSLYLGVTVGATTQLQQLLSFRYLSFVDSLEAGGIGGMTNDFFTGVGLLLLGSTLFTKVESVSRLARYVAGVIFTFVAMCLVFASLTPQIGIKPF